MSDHHHTIRRAAGHPCRPRRADRDRDPAVALYLAVGPPRPEAARAVGDDPAAGGQARHRGGAVHLQMGDRCAGRHRQRAGGVVRLAAVGHGGADRHDHRLWRHAHPDGGADAIARRPVRQGGDARGAAARLPHLRAHARTVAALPSRAQDRRPDARAGARPQRHRDHRADGDPATGADRHRAGADRRHPDVAVRLALCRADPGHRHRLHGVHLLRHRMAHRHPPQDERQRLRRQRQGDRLAAQLRDGEVFLRRGARGAALRQVDGALRERQRQRLYLARRAQRRAGGDLHLRARRRHGDVRARNPRRHQDGRRFRADQRHDDPALPAAEFHGHGLPRDQAGDHRHRTDVLDPVARAGDQGRAGRAAARRHAGRRALRERRLFL